MQPLSWYVRRLRGMSGGEIAWRIRSLLRDAGDRARLACGSVPRSSSLPQALSAGPGFRTPGSLAAWDAPAPEERAWREALAAQAGSAAAHRLSFFDLRDHFLGDPIDWNRDHSAGKAAPLGFAGAIDYRDFEVTGDCKLVWEPSRHQHLVVLARAFRVTGDERYATAAAAQLESWLDQCPFGHGMNWRSPLELAIRLINWVWVLDLLEGSDAVSRPLRERVFHSAWLHLREISRKLSKGSSANNHVIGEAAGLFIGAAYFRGFAEAPGWMAESAALLEREIVSQTYADGGNREQAFAYHLFVLEFFLLAGLVGRWAGREFTAGYWSQIEKMLEFAGALAEGGEEPPAYGDADDGYVLDLGGRHDVPSLLSTGAVLYGRADFKRWARRLQQTTVWLLGPESRARFAAVPSEAEVPLRSRAFPDTGYYLLQSGTAGSEDGISVLFDCGELGFGAIAAHGHADALSLTLRAFGTDVLVDPGTYDYFTHPQWRQYFRGTRAHNTLAVGERDQSEMLGPFLWGARAQARCLHFHAEDAGGGEVAGDHDGYATPEDPLVHRRTVRLEGAARIVTVCDEIETDGWHRIALCFHLAEHCQVLGRDHNRFEIGVADRGLVVVELDSRLSVELLTGSDAPPGGWVSRGYHRKTASTTLVGNVDCMGRSVFVCRVEVLPAGVGVSKE